MITKTTIVNINLSKILVVSIASKTVLIRGDGKRFFLFFYLIFGPGPTILASVAVVQCIAYVHIVLWRQEKKNRLNGTETTNVVTLTCRTQLYSNVT